MSRLMISISGIRGIIGETLTPEAVVKFAAAYGTYAGPGRVIIGRDSRISGPMMHNAVVAGLQAVGCTPVDVGICPTPTVELATRRHGESGGIIITASHNPIQWNALKLLNKDGLFLNAEQGNRVIEIANSEKFKYVPYNELGKYETFEHAVREHQEAVLDLPYIDVKSLQKRRFKVVIDGVNGAGSICLPEFLEKLGCEVVAINCTPNGIFPHTPEPVPENLTQLCESVKKNNADIGFAVDPDADRLAIVSEKGIPLGEEYTLALAIKFLLGKKRGPVVINASTSLASEDVARELGMEVVRTKVGEIHVTQKLLEINAVIGGEGNGGIILPDVHPGRDAVVGIALTLQALLESGQTISRLKSSLPQYEIVKLKLELGDSDPKMILNKLIERHSQEKIDQIDGVKFLGNRTWVQVRASNTEPIVRIMAEAPTAQDAQALGEKYLQEIRSLI